MQIVFLVLMFLIALSLVGSLGGVIQLAIAMLIWMFVGNVAGHLIRGEDYGVAGNIALGLAGGIVGTFLMSLLGWGGLLDFPLLGYIISGVIGAIVFMFMMRLVDKNFGK